jgi:hypothetical protein
MNKILSWLAIGVAAGGIASAACADTSTVSTTGSTTIVQPVTIAKTHDLAFATIVRPTTGNGTVALTASSDTVNVTGTGTLATGTASRAKYTITGEGGQVVAVSFPATFDMSDGNSHTLTVTLASDASGGTTTLSSTLGNTGTASLNIGGSFPVSSTTTSAAYTGTFNVDVAYQ